MNITLREFLIIAALIFAGFVLQSLTPILMPFVAGCIGAYALSPLVKRLEHLHIGRVLGATFAMILFLACVGGILVILVPYLHRELVIISSNIPLFTQKVLTQIMPIFDAIPKEWGMPSLGEVKTQITAHMGQIAQVMVNFLISVLGSGMVLANMISILILTPVVMFYFLKDWESFLSAVHKLIPKKLEPKVMRYVHAVDTTLGGYAKGQALVCLVQIIVYSAGLYLIRVPDALFIGFMTGFLAFIPYLGSFIGFILSLIVIMIHFQGGWQILALITVFTLINLFEGNVLTPRLIGKKVGLHPIWIIFSLLAAGNWFGFMGVVVALPVAASLSAITRVMMQDYYKSKTYIQTK